MRRLYASVSFLIPLTLSAAAYADDDDAKNNCPPGSWFCESVEVEVSDGEDDENSGPQREVDDDLATTPDDSPTSDGTVKKRKRVEIEADDDIEVEADNDTVVVVKKKKHRKRRHKVVVREDDAVEELYAKKRKKQRRWRERFGLNLRIEGAAIAGRYGDTVGMGGAGGSFRWRPSPYFAFDVGADIVGGNDYNGDERVEVSGAVSGLIYFNPQHRVQVYGIGGMHISHAEVDTHGDYYDYDYSRTTWGVDGETRDYFGGHGGIGLEFRISRHFAMFADAMALIRTRVDSDVPEYYDPETGQGTNTSGAGLFRTGVTFWW